MKRFLSILLATVMVSTMATAAMAVSGNFSGQNHPSPFSIRVNRLGVIFDGENQKYHSIPDGTSVNGAGVIYYAINLKLPTYMEANAYYGRSVFMSGSRVEVTIAYTNVSGKSSEAYYVQLTDKTQHLWYNGSGFDAKWDPDPNNDIGADNSHILSAAVVGSGSVSIKACIATPGKLSDIKIDGCYTVEKKAYSGVVPCADCTPIDLKGFLFKGDCASYNIFLSIDDDKRVTNAYVVDKAPSLSLTPFSFDKVLYGWAPDSIIDCQNPDIVFFKRVELPMGAEIEASDPATAWSRWNNTFTFNGLSHADMDAKFAIWLALPENANKDFINDSYDQVYYMEDDEFIKVTSWASSLRGSILLPNTVSGISTNANALVEPIPVLTLPANGTAGDFFSNRKNTTSLARTDATKLYSGVMENGLFDGTPLGYQYNAGWVQYGKTKYLQRSDTPSNAYTTDKMPKLPFAPLFFNKKLYGWAPYGTTTDCRTGSSGVVTFKHIELPVGAEIDASDPATAWSRWNNTFTFNGLSHADMDAKFAIWLALPENANKDFINDSYDQVYYMEDDEFMKITSWASSLRGSILLPDTANGVSTNAYTFVEPTPALTVPGNGTASDFFSNKKITTTLALTDTTKLYVGVMEDNLFRSSTLGYQYNAGWVQYGKVFHLQSHSSSSTMSNAINHLCALLGFSYADIAAGKVSMSEDMLLWRYGLSNSVCDSQTWNGYTPSNDDDNSGSSDRDDFFDDSRNNRNNNGNGNVASSPNADIQLSGANVPNGDSLVTTPTENSTLRELIINDNLKLVGMWDISLKSGKTNISDSTFSFKVGKAGAGKVYTLYHLKADGTVEEFTAVADDKGVVSFSNVHSLSPFMLVEGGTLTAISSVVGVPATGDRDGIGLWLGLLFLAGGMSAAFIRRRKYQA